MYETSRATTNKNHILSALPRDDYERLVPHLESVKLAQSQNHLPTIRTDPVCLLSDRHDGFRRF